MATPPVVVLCRGRKGTNTPFVSVDHNALKGLINVVIRDMNGVSGSELKHCVSVVNEYMTKLGDDLATIIVVVDMRNVRNPSALLMHVDVVKELVQTGERERKCRPHAPRPMYMLVRLPGNAPTLRAIAITLRNTLKRPEQTPVFIADAHAHVPWEVDDKHPREVDVRLFAT